MIGSVTIDTAMQASRPIHNAHGIQWTEFLSSYRKHSLMMLCFSKQIEVVNNCDSIGGLSHALCLFELYRHAGKDEMNAKQ